MKREIPEMINGDVFLLRRPEYNATQLWQIREGKCQLLTEFRGDVEQYQEKSN